MRLLAWLLGRWLVRRYRYKRGAWRSSLQPRYGAQYRHAGGDAGRC